MTATGSMKVLLKVAQGTGNVELGRVPTLKAGPDRVLIRVHACGILGSDLKMEADEHPFVPPEVMGHEFAGAMWRLAGT